MTRALVISAAWPEDLQRFRFGGAQRFLTLLDGVKRVADEIDLLFFVGTRVPHDDADHLARATAALADAWGLARMTLTLCPMDDSTVALGSLWRGYLRPALSVRWQETWQPTSGARQAAAVRRAMARAPDLVFVHRLAAMTAVLAAGCRHGRIHLDLDDVEHVAFARRIAEPPLWRMKQLQRLQLPALRRHEARAFGAAACTYVCSEADRQLLAGLHPRCRFAVVPNSVRLPAQPLQRGPGAAGPDPVLLFVGQLRYGPNRVGLEHFVRTAWPLIRNRLPAVRLRVAGEGREGFADDVRSAPGVEFLGFVDDLDAVYAGATIVICPLLAGGGTRIKILEAAAHGLPVVSTTIGAEGLALAAGREIAIADSPGDFAGACLMLLDAPATASAMGAAARAAVAMHYGREAVVEQVARLLGEA